MTRILVGTLYCGENEFEECCRSLESQVDARWKHFVIENLPNLAAHEAIYQTFMSQAEDFDLFLKLDADMVIQRKDFLRDLSDWFESRPKVHCLSVRVWDWFTQKPVDGIHTFRSATRWPERRDEVFTDYGVELKGEHVINNRLFPKAVLHAGNPTDFQAFRFGIHKAWKIRAGYERGIRRRYSSTRQHIFNIRHLWTHLHKTQDPRLIWACYGAELMLSGHWPLKNFDYNNLEVMHAFQAEQSRGHEERLLEVIRLRKRNRWRNGWTLRGLHCEIESLLANFCRPVKHGARRVQGRLHKLFDNQQSAER